MPNCSDTKQPIEGLLFDWQVCFERCHSARDPMGWGDNPGGGPGTLAGGVSLARCGSVQPVLNRFYPSKPHLRAGYPSKFGSRPRC